ncbi:XRE family transcriptional regulator [Streptomyces sp. NPDC001787]|uniref:XRE family transcriptional regulator n=1 Tax=Streptomyces sp. NPDC001787 TaxID=3154523 RepID=UPI003324AFD7
MGIIDDSLDRAAARPARYSRRPGRRFVSWPSSTRARPRRSRSCSASRSGWSSAYLQDRICRPRPERAEGLAGEIDDWRVRRITQHLPPVYAARLFDAQSSRATERQLQDITAEGLQDDQYFTARSTRVAGLQVELTDIGYIELVFRSSPRGYHDPSSPETKHDSWHYGRRSVTRTSGQVGPVWLT